MKTNVVFTLLLAAMVALMMGCEAASWQSKIAGSYKTIITNGGDEYPAKTVLKTDDDKVTGTYWVDVFGSEHDGKLTNFTITGDRKLKCRWYDDVDREGNVKMTFAPDLSSFKGEWDSDDGGGDGGWNGKK